MYVFPIFNRFNEEKKNGVAVLLHEIITAEPDDLLTNIDLMKYVHICVTMFFFFAYSSSSLHIFSNDRLTN